MQVLEKDKKEIEIRASKMSDFLRMEYLETCLKKFNDHEIQKFCSLELSKLYESKFMYPEAVKYIFRFQEITGNPSEKKKAMMKEIELLIKGGLYDKAESVVRKTIPILNEADRFELRRNVVMQYEELAMKSEKSSKNSELIKIYEKLLNYVVDVEKKEVKKRLAGAYKRLGRIRESIEIEKELEREKPAENKRTFTI